MNKIQMFFLILIIIMLFFSGCINDSNTNNDANNIDLVVPCNNKGRRSLGLLFWIFAREYMRNRNMIKNDKEFTHSIEDFGVD